jgi:molybdate transport repressor ModE-like protein
MQIEVRPTLTYVTKNGDNSSIDLVWLGHCLKDIERTNSLISASKKSGVSFRNAWGKMNDVEEALGMRLILRTKGHGSKLTKLGQFLIQFVEEMQNSYLDSGLSYQEILFREIKKIQKIEVSKWKFLSSSDSIIQRAASEIEGFDLRISGSGESLERLLGDEADIAGYHVSDEKSSKAIHRRLLKSNIQIYPVMKRTQGFLVKKGNPLHIKSVDDLLNPKIRFVNRQIGSGTRLLLDTLLIEEDIDPSEVNGYFHEEFTHSAVANAILANKADAGLGVKNIALESGLGFVPIKDEIFFIAMKKEMAAQSEASKLIRKIRSYSGETPGYKAVGLNRQIEGWL